MVQINFSEKEINLKIVYFGPPLSGKTTNIEAIRHNTPVGNQIEWKKEESGQDTTLSFTYIPTEGMEVAGMKVKNCTVCTVSGQVRQKDTWQKLLPGVDGIIFVADSQNSQQQGNLAALRDLEAILAKMGNPIFEIPLVIQYNKCDLPHIASAEEMNQEFHKYSSEVVMARALEGAGVFPTLDLTLKITLGKVQKQLVEAKRSLPKGSKWLAHGKTTESEGKAPIAAKSWRIQKEEPNRLEEGLRVGLASLPADHGQAQKPVSPPGEPEADRPVAKEKPALAAEGKVATRPGSLPKKWRTTEITQIDPLNDNEMAETHPLPTIPPDSLPEEVPLSPVKEATTTKIDFSPSSEPRQSANEGENDPIVRLETGLALENQDIEKLDLSNRVFHRPILIRNCLLGNIIANNTQFEAPVVLEQLTIAQQFLLGGDKGTRFQGKLTLKKVNVEGTLDWSRAYFQENVLLRDCHWQTIAKIHGALFGSGLSLINNAIQGIEFNDSRLQGILNFSGGNFEEVTDFQKCLFEGTVSFSEVTFQRAHFMQAIFLESVVFSNCRFNKSGNFGKANFKQGVQFQSLLFNGSTTFAEAEFDFECIFRRTHFKDDVYFNHVVSHGPLLLEKTNFYALADFSLASFDRLELLQCEFEGSVSFQEAIFNDLAHFLATNFKNRTNFSRAIFFRKVDFSQANFFGMLSLADIMGDHVILRRGQVEGHLIADREKDYHRCEKEYATLERMLEQQNQYEDKEWAYYKRKRAHRQAVPFSLLHPFRGLKKLGNWLLLDLSCGYGTKPFNLLWIALLVIVGFTALYHLRFQSQVGVVSLETPWPALSIALQWTQTLYFSFAAFTHTLPGHWSPVDGVDLFKYFVTLEGLIGILLIFLFVVNFTRRYLSR